MIHDNFRFFAQSINECKDVLVYSMCENFIMILRENYPLFSNVEKESLLYHRITEALKFAYGQRSNLGKMAIEIK